MIATQNPLFRLTHIRDEIDAITTALRGVNREQYAGDYLRRRAAERALLVISEAAKSLPSDLLQRYPQINWSEVIGLGNVLRHGYHAVDDDTIWVIFEHEPPRVVACGRSNDS